SRCKMNRRPDRLRAIPSLFLFAARVALMLLIAGLLLGRRDFAHLNLGDLWTLFSLTPPVIFSRAFATETTLLALLPFALWMACDRFQGAAGNSWREKFWHGF